MRQANLDDAQHWPWQTITRKALALIAGCRWRFMEHVPNAPPGATYFMGQLPSGSEDGIMLTDAPSLARFGAISLVVGGTAYTFRMLDEWTALAFSVAEAARAEGRTVAWPGSRGAHG